MKWIPITCLLVLICLYGCRKENDNQNFSLDKLIGLYCGDFKVKYGEGIQNTTISQTDIDSLKFIYRNFASIPSPVIVKIKKNYTFVIDKQTFKPDYFYATVTGFGYYDTAQGMMHINYQILYDGINQENEDGVIELYNISNYSYGGTYSGDSITMIMSSGTDTLDISLQFPENWMPCGWDHIKAIDKGCYYSFIPDTFRDVCSDQLRIVQGSASKRGNKLEIGIRAFSLSMDGFLLYEFTVTKVKDKTTHTSSGLHH
jgi:hypothetical protein